MKISTRSLALMALAISTSAEACAPPPRREPVECTKVVPSRAQAWLAVLIREGYLNPDGSPRQVVRPPPRPFEDDHLQPPPPPTPRPPKECHACGRG